MNVCVYSICKNESKNVLKYLDSIKDADLIVINDTGSTDDTVDLIDTYDNPNINIIENIYEDFDFSVARNDALNEAKELIHSMIDEYGNNNKYNWIFLSLDFDEFIAPGVINRMKSEIKDTDNIDTIWLYGISPNEGTSTYIDTKAHTWNFYWHRSIHEIIKHYNKKYKEWNIFNPGDNKYIYYHYQDLSKKRDYYGMLQKAYSKDKYDVKTATYLCWESILHNDYDNLIEYANQGLYNIQNSKQDEYYNDPQYLIQIYKYLSIYYKHEKDNKRRIESLELALNIINSNQFPDIRIIHYLLAEAYWDDDRKTDCCNEYEKCLTINNNIGYWVEDKNLYENEASIYSKLSTAYYYINNIELSIYYGVLANKKDPNNDLYKNNIKSIINGFKNKVLLNEI